MAPDVLAPLGVDDPSLDDKIEMRDDLTSVKLPMIGDDVRYGSFERSG